MNPVARAAGLRDRAMAPVIARLDQIAVLTGQLSARIDDLSSRISAMERLLDEMEARTATVTERQYAYEEDRIRTARRLEEIEKLLAER